jgi:succinate dehydrogenase/fumarate reductase flavoprotein subunit
VPALRRTTRTRTPSKKKDKRKTRRAAPARKSTNLHAREDEGSSVPRIHLTDGRGLGLVRPIYLECLINPNITFRWNEAIKTFLSEHGTVRGVRGQNLRTGQEADYRAKAVILATRGFQSKLRPRTRPLASQSAEATTITRRLRR